MAAWPDARGIPSACLAPVSVPSANVPTNNDEPPSLAITTGRPVSIETFSDHSSTGITAATVNRGGANSASAGMQTSRFARVRTARPSSTPAATKRRRVKPSSAAVSNSAPSGSDSRSPPMTTSGG